MKPNRALKPTLCKYYNKQLYLTPKIEHLTKNTKKVKKSEKVKNLEMVINNIKTSLRARRPR